MIDLCGKYLISLNSLFYHMGMHTNNLNYMCENCGVKFFSRNGVRQHKCLKTVRRRAATDSRIYDRRHCRFCDSHFASYDENKAHHCKFMHPDDKKVVTCRFCLKIVGKSTFIQHLEIHSGIDWICKICNKKLATERALKRKINYFFLLHTVLKFFLLQFT